MLQSRYVNNMTHAKRRTNERWRRDETDLFYKAVAMYGTDFTAIARLFPDRDR